MIGRFTFLLLILITYQASFSQSLSVIKGKIVDEEGKPLPYVNILLESTNLGSSTNTTGDFIIHDVPAGTYNIIVSQVGYQKIIKPIVINPSEEVGLTFIMQAKASELDQVEVFGEREKQPEKLATITRLPLKPSDQIQSISVISDRLIEMQGNLTISEAARNVPGVYTFATYGNVRESMSSRGFRGIPVLKNGVRVNSDFRGTGILADMQGVESIQVLKGAAAITQGVATDLGSPGGIINIVTKTPKFYQGGQASLRVGSWGQVRPSFDVYGPLNETKTVAYRINGAYERADSYRKGISYEKMYVNPSMEWRPDDRTTLTLEMDYLNDSRTPDPGTINLASNDINAIYELPYDRFLGFNSDRVITKNATYTARFTRELTNNISVRAAYVRSNLDTEQVGASLSSGGGRGNAVLPQLDRFEERYRKISASNRIDNNSVLQLDLIGKDLVTGPLKHTFQVGIDYRSTFLETKSATQGALDYVDIINVYNPIDSKLPGSGFRYDSNTDEMVENAININPSDPVTSNNNAYGLMAQDVISFTDWAKIFLGVRYSSVESSGSAITGVSIGNAIDPQFGLMISPYKGLNLFGSYTTSTSLRGADNVDVNGNELGNQKIKQLEAGLKSDWLDNRLRFNLTFYKINNKNMSLPVYDANWVATGYYQKGGNDERKGVEVELIGRIARNLELVTGYAYIDAQYKEHVSYYEGSAPLNTPKHTANAWANYAISEGLLKGVNIGAGVYYISDRPVNDWATAVTHEGIVPNQKPFDINAYTVVNAQIGYNVNKVGVRLLFNNIFDAIGYNAYRTSFINQIDPRNFAGVITYRF